MGGNGSKQTNGKKEQRSNAEHEPSYELSQRNNELKDPHNNRPVELSWLQQNNINDNHDRVDNHHHIHHDERLRRIPLAINRWSQPIDQTQEQKSKSFIEEYVRQ